MTDALKPDVSGQIIANRMSFFSRTAKASATVASEATAMLENVWPDLDKRLRMVPGKQVLSALNGELQRTAKLSITPAQIVRHMKVEEIPGDLRTILEAIDKFAAN